MDDWDESETTGVKDLKVEAIRNGMLEHADAKVAELLKKYLEDK